MEVGKAFRSFYMVDGSETSLFAAFCRFALQNGLHQEVESSICNYLDALPPYRMEGLRYDTLRRLFLVSTGQSNEPRHHNDLMGWTSLVPPMSCQAGRMEDVGGTAIYTQEDIFGNHSLVIAPILPLGRHEGVVEDDEGPIELYPSDSVRLLPGILGSAEGEYGKEMEWLSRRVLHHLDDLAREDDVLFAT